MSNSNKMGLVSIYIRLTKNRRLKYLALGLDIQQGNSYEKTWMMTPTARNLTVINNYITRKEAEAIALGIEIYKNS